MKKSNNNTQKSMDLHMENGSTIKTNAKMRVRDKKGTELIKKNPIQKLMKFINLCRQKRWTVRDVSWSSNYLTALLQIATFFCIWSSHSSVSADSNLCAMARFAIRVVLINS